MIAKSRGRPGHSFRADRGFFVVCRILTASIRAKGGTSEMAGSVLLTRAGRALATVIVAGGIFGATIATSASPAAALNACTAGVKCPKANDDTYQASLGGPLNVPAPGLLANDQGPAGTVVDVADSDTTSWFGAEVAVHADGSFTYTPDSNVPSAGADTFDYYIEDVTGAWDLATATVNITAVIRDDQYSTNPNRTLLVKAPGVLGNDVGYDADNLSGDDTSANGGDVTLNGDGSFAYVPPTGFHGTDTFTYTIDDTDDDNTYTATVHIDVNGPPAPVTAAPHTGNSTPGNTGPGASSGSGGAKPGATSGTGSTTPGATNKPVPTGKGGKLGKPPDSAAKGAPGSATNGKPTDAHASGASASGPVAVLPGSHQKSSSNTALVIVIALVIAAAAFGGGWYLWRRRVLAQKPPPVT